MASMGCPRERHGGERVTWRPSDEPCAAWVTLALAIQRCSLTSWEESGKLRLALASDIHVLANLILP